MSRSPARGCCAAFPCGWSRARAWRWLAATGRGRPQPSAPSWASFPSPAGIGYAPEERKLFPTFTVEENLRLPAEVLKLPEAEIARRLEKAYAILPEVKGFADRKAGGLSGGQGKMVALGRALMVGTKLVLLDEPFQGLAPALAKRYGEALLRLREAEPGLAVLISESNPDLLKPMVDSAFLIERGEVRPTTL